VESSVAGAREDLAGEPENQLCPHILLEDSLDPDVALAMSQEFPSPASEIWTQYKHVNENKLGLPKRDLFPPLLGAVTDELNSPEFVTWVSILTGIPNLLADPGEHHQDQTLA